MCISFPGQVIAVDPSGAVVDSDGRRRRASTLLYPDVAVGDWVAVAAGTIVDRLSATESVELQELLDQARERDPAAPRIVRKVAVPTSANDPTEGEPDVQRN
jgi:hydrogenase assembly chaperone HypC/HupF